MRCRFQFEFISIILCLLMAIGNLKAESAENSSKPSNSHRILKSIKACNYDRDIVDEDVYIFESDEEAKKYIRKIANSSGVADNFEIYAADVPNAAATIIGEKRYILYNQTFMEQVRTAAGTNWSSLAILAHEIGHHINGHHLDQLGSRPHKEIDADIYAGFALAQMGATLEQAQSAFRVFGDPEEEITHPKKARRLAAVANGWKRAKDIIAQNNPQESGEAEKSEAEKRRVKKQVRRKKSPNNQIRPIVEFSRMRANWKTKVDGQNGFILVFDLDVQNVRTERGRLWMQFYSEDGKLLTDKNGAYGSADGFAVTWADVNLQKPGGKFIDLKMAFPYNELHLAAGEHKIRLEVFYGEVVSDSEVTWIKKSNQVEFKVKVGAPSE